MPNNVNYAERWEPELLEIFMQESLISPFITNNVRFMEDGKTFHFTQMSTTGFKSHNRNGGWNRGSFTQTDVPFTLKHDRDISFLVDKADVSESNATASIQNIAKVFTRTQSTPEKNALFFSKCAALAKEQEGYHSTNALTAWTKANVLSKLKGMIAAGKLRIYRAKGALIVYVRSEIMDLLEMSEEIKKTIEMTQIAEGGAGIETRVARIDGVPVFEVIDDEVFYDSFNFDSKDGGFVPVEAGDGVEASKHLNVLIASPLTTKFVPKISSIYYFNPGAHTEGDGYLYQERELSDVFTFPNGKSGKIDSLYVDVEG